MGFRLTYETINHDFSLSCRLSCTPMQLQILKLTPAKFNDKLRGFFFRYSLTNKAFLVKCTFLISALFFEHAPFAPSPLCGLRDF